MFGRVLVACAIVAVVCVNAQVPFNRIAPRQNLCRVQSEDFRSWQDFSYVTPGAPSYDDGAIKQTLRSISNSTTVYQAQIYKSSSNVHSAWPLLDFSQTALGKFSTPAYIDFYFLKQGFNIPSDGFASIATFSPDGDTPSRYVSLDMNSQGMIYFNNVPAQNSPVGNWVYQKTNGGIAENTWINMTVYVDFNPSGGILVVWQDGVIQSVANVTGSSSATLGQLHLGLVASGSISSGSIYNYGLNIMQVCAPAPSSISTAPSAPTIAPTGTTTSSPSSPTSATSTTTSGPSSVASTTTQAPANIPIPNETTTSPDRQSSASSRLGVSHWLIVIIALNVVIQIL